MGRGALTVLEARRAECAMVHSRLYASPYSGFPDLLSSWQAEGADAGLQKPTEVPELLATISRLVGDR